MIGLGTYSKEQLIAITGISDLSNIKRSLDRQGYSYTTNGKKGKSYLLTIVTVPNDTATVKFRDLCKNFLQIEENIDFKKLANLIYFLHADESFSSLSLSEMEEKIKEQTKNVELTLSRQTIAKYLEYLSRANVYVLLSDFRYYVKLDTSNKAITQQQYSEAWQFYYNLRNSLPAYEAYQILIDRYGGKPMKHRKYYFGNGIYKKELDQLIELATAIVKES